MICLRASKAAILYATLWTSLLCAADFSNYRGFRFDTNLATAATHAGMKPSEARLIHQRPAVIQELNWRPRYPYQSSAKQEDPVQESLLRFYNGQLFQIVTTYDRPEGRRDDGGRHDRSHLTNLRGLHKTRG